MADTRSGEIQSPCINVCQLNVEQVCEGCWRHIDEIAAWGLLSNSERCAVLAAAEKRQAATLAGVNI